MTSSLPGSLPPFLLSGVPLSSPPPHVSYVLATAEKSVTPQVPKMKLVGDRTEGASPCTPSSSVSFSVLARERGRDVYGGEAGKG